MREREREIRRKKESGERSKRRETAKVVETTILLEK